MAKGSKKDRWLKDGMKQSKKGMKKWWNKKVRNTDNLPCNGSYKKLSKDTAYCRVP